MTWFFNNAGVADGPHEEPAMQQMARQGSLNPQTLIWHSQLSDWQEAVALNPGWWQPVKAELPKTAPKVDPSARRSPVPLAPTEAPKKETGGGLLKRWFGGKK